MNIWIPLALIAGSLTTPAFANLEGATDEAIIAAKKEVAEAQAHLEQLLGARETTQLTVTAVNTTTAPEIAWEVVSTGDTDANGCSAHGPVQKNHSAMGTGLHEGGFSDWAMGSDCGSFESNTGEMDCSSGDMSMGNGHHGMRHGAHGMGHGKSEAGHGMRGMHMDRGNDNECECNSGSDRARGPHHGMMSPGRGHGKAPHQECPHATGGHKGHGQAPHATMRGMMFMDGHEGPSHGNHGWKDSDQDGCGQGCADQDDDNQGHRQAWWFDDDSDDARGEGHTQGMAFGHGEQQFEWLMGDEPQCDFGNESSEDAECDSWRDGNDCAQGLDATESMEYTFEITDREPNWVTGTLIDATSAENIDTEIEVLLQRLEADGVVGRVIRISSDDDFGPEQLQAMIEIELDDNACNASEDVDSEIDALIREIECSIEADAVIEAEQPTLEDAEVRLLITDESSSRIEELEGEVADLRELVESLVKELNKH